jgi:serine phosphatase RsbU (regulator of sigma subunit)/anti-sigma regulatory factor (Ser/Thr protein kinase)
MSKASPAPTELAEEDPGVAPASVATLAGATTTPRAAGSDTALAYTSLEGMLEGLLEGVRDVLRADTAAVLLLDADRKVLIARAARGLEEEVRQGIQVPLARGFAGRIAAEARPIQIEDLEGADVVNPLLRQRGIRSMLGVPIGVEGRVIGVMHVGTLERRVFDQRDVSLMQSAADRAARAIDLAHATEERAVTQVMQRTLLPDALPSIPGMRFSAKYLPAGTGVKIGGDWYDVFQLPDGRVTFVIGDVVGRGAVAASVMSEIRIALRAYLMEGHRLPAVMSLLNRLLVSMGRSRSATAAIFELDPETGELEGVSAGHPPPLLVDRAGQPRFLEVRPGMPLGIVRDADYTSSTMRFATGDMLLLYTDGLVERRGEPIDDGMERLQTAALAATHGEDATFADRVYRGLLESAMLDSATLEDDVALLAIESLRLGETIELTLDAEPAVLAGLRRTLGRWLDEDGVGVGVEDRFGITLAVSEAAANAVEHAYGARSATFTVRCEFDRPGGQVRAIVADDGRWRASRPYGRGRGLAIMRALVDDVEVDRREDGTTVTLIKKIVEGQP